MEGEEHGGYTCEAEGESERETAAGDGGEGTAGVCLKGLPGAGGGRMLLVIFGLW